MFAVYKKIISPESSPILGPASPNLAPMTNGSNAMESLSLCNCCCSTRNKLKDPVQDPIKQSPIQDPIQEDPIQYPIQYPIKPKYEFGHATHYVYGVTSPRLLCEFETGTIP